MTAPSRHRPFKAIAAMSLNRVIGVGNRIPWHLPADFQWFKRTTLGHRLLMGRRTFESIGKPLPGRETFVLSRQSLTLPGAAVIPRLDAVDWDADPREVFVCGGAQIYTLALPQCSDLFLTLVLREVSDGDAFFPTFESEFTLERTIEETPEFRILHYRRCSAGNHETA